MNTDIQPTGKASIIERVMMVGDLSKLSADERVSYYMSVCQSLGLNPLTRPFEYITLQGKLVMYARKDATEQLRKINGVSIDKPVLQFDEGLVMASVTATDASGRSDSEVGAVNIEGLRGDARANAIMKAVTKAKRRVTLSICGLGMLDETEVETIPDAKPVRVTDTGAIEQSAIVKATATTFDPAALSAALDWLNAVNITAANAADVKTQVTAYADTYGVHLNGNAKTLADAVRIIRTSLEELATR